MDWTLYIWSTKAKRNGRSRTSIYLCKKVGSKSEKVLIKVEQNYHQFCFYFVKNRNGNATCVSQQDAAKVDHMRCDLLAFAHLKTRQWIIHPKNLLPWNQAWKVQLIFFFFLSLYLNKSGEEAMCPKGKPLQQKQWIDNLTLSSLFSSTICAPTACGKRHAGSEAENRLSLITENQTPEWDNKRIGSMLTFKPAEQICVFFFLPSFYFNLNITSSHELPRLASCCFTSSQGSCCLPLIRRPHIWGL